MILESELSGSTAGLIANAGESCGVRPEFKRLRTHFGYYLADKLGGVTLSI